MTDQPWQQESVIRHSQRLIKSFQHWTETPLITGSVEEPAQSLFEAPFVVVSHGTESDPIFNYGNAQALALWQFDWDSFTQLPSRRSAEPVEQIERDRLLLEAKSHGYIRNYRGIRISSTGQRFWIEDVILWDVLDENYQRCGQAATFSDWKLVGDLRET
ncbi:MEKHLA domain-containing protein [Phormidesmis priestleyi]|uniref:MEKHLA domain-containing protein n=1 Tax=Phormidesmis priestleyi TaxID=268141 RepID=UPI00083BA08D|nr:MEKHLA domain-containing protein [Phormidesmis priestleyi]